MSNKLSTHPSEKSKLKKQSQQSLFLRLSFFLPLILGFFFYRYINSGAFLPLSCQLFNLRCPVAKDTVRGFVDPRFKEVKEIFEKNIENGEEVGAAVTVYYQDKIIVDLTGGIADIETGRIYDKDTLQLVFSSTKVLTAIVIARLVEKGILDYSEKIATYWPEFAQGNKENVTLHDLLTHTAGVGWIDTKQLTMNDLKDFNHFDEILARQPHNFDGNPIRSYHALTRGFYLNAIVRRVDPKNRTIGQIVAEEILPTYNIDFHYKTTKEIYPRVASIYTYPLPRILGKLLLPKWMISNPLHTLFNYMFDSSTVTFKTLVATSPDQSQPKDWNSFEMLQYEGPSYSGVTNSRSMAKLAAIMANEGQPLPDSKEPPLFKKSTFDLLTKNDKTEYDIAIHESISMLYGGLGNFSLDGLDWQYWGWGGSGGSMLLWNPEHKVAVGYCMNAFHTALLGDHRSLNLMKSVSNTIKKLKAIEE
ncbi:beta-lactamase/transpeptidase-like protein [Gigaspora margarita]|uniref:Beta-lactamase/transpeptidase-like protein n=1 Tax=Gigaspora margarita TaxID=4874 RepID=A0A8H3XJS4_GIGMA|nr:beta-lactamase/transpeptidase-like protein [Gigaspora margarita]